MLFFLIFYAKMHLCFLIKYCTSQLFSIVIVIFFEQQISILE